jgi:hypothetical protein
MLTSSAMPALVTRSIESLQSRGGKRDSFPRRVFPHALAWRTFSSASRAASQRVGNVIGPRNLIDYRSRVTSQEHDRFLDQLGEVLS